MNTNKVLFDIIVNINVIVVRSAIQHCRSVLLLANWLSFLWQFFFAVCKNSTLLFLTLFFFPDFFPALLLDLIYRLVFWVTQHRGWQLKPYYWKVSCLHPPLLPYWLLYLQTLVSKSPLLDQSCGNLSRPGPCDTHCRARRPVRLLCRLIRFDSSNWISPWNKHPFRQVGGHTNTPSTGHRDRTQLIVYTLTFILTKSC